MPSRTRSRIYCAIGHLSDLTQTILPISLPSLTRTFVQRPTTWPRSWLNSTGGSLLSLSSCQPAGSMTSPMRSIEPSRQNEFIRLAARRRRRALRVEHGGHLLFSRTRDCRRVGIPIVNRFECCARTALCFCAPGNLGLAGIDQRELCASIGVALQNAGLRIRVNNPRTVIDAAQDPPDRALARIQCDKPDRAGRSRARCARQMPVPADRNQRPPGRRGRAPSHTRICPRPAGRQSH